MDNLTIRGETFNHTNAGFVAGTTNTYTTTLTTTCSIRGKFATTLAAQTNTALTGSPPLDAGTGLPFRPLSPNKATVLVWGVNAAGAIKVCQGSIVDTAPGVTTTVGAFINAPQFPALPEDFCACAYQLVRTAPSAATWTPGTSNWTASGVTGTAMVNVAVLPDRPQIS